jgi:hypothetical protein
MKKPLAVVVFLLFIGLVIVPCGILRAKTEKDELRVVLQTDKINYQIGEPVDISIYVENQGDEDITIVFPSAQKADFRISDCYLWSWDKVFIPIQTTLTIPSGMQVSLLSERWEQVDSSGNQVPPGALSITGWMVQSEQYPAMYAQPMQIRIGSDLHVAVHGGLGIIVSVINDGDFPVDAIQCAVSVDWGLLGLMNATKNKYVDHLNVSESFSSTLVFFGFGPVHLTIRVTSSNAEMVVKEGQMFVMLIIVYPVIPPLSMV